MLDEQLALGNQYSEPPIYYLLKTREERKVFVSWLNNVINLTTKQYQEGGAEKILEQRSSYNSVFPILDNTEEFRTLMTNLCGPIASNTEPDKQEFLTQWLDQLITSLNDDNEPAPWEQDLFRNNPLTPFITRIIRDHLDFQLDYLRPNVIVDVDKLLKICEGFIFGDPEQDSPNPIFNFDSELIIAEKSLLEVQEEIDVLIDNREFDNLAEILNQETEADRLLVFAAQLHKPLVKSKLCEGTYILQIAKFLRETIMKLQSTELEVEAKEQVNNCLEYWGEMTKDSQKCLIARVILSSK